MSQSNDSGLNLDHLEACPFCGGPAKIVKWTGSPTEIRCDPCGIAMDGLLDEVIGSWNRRAALANQPAPTVPAESLGQPSYQLAAAWNSLRWMLNKSDECDSPNMRATTLLDKHHSKSGNSVRDGLEYLWAYFKPIDTQLTALLLAGGDDRSAHQPAQEQAEKWRHAANEWADTAYNGLQHLRNIEDGITEAKAARENMETCCQHARAVADAAQQEPVAAPKESLNGGNNA